MYKTAVLEQELIESLRKGSIFAFDTLFEQYSQRLYLFALKYFKNKEDADELVQEVFVKVWMNRSNLKSEYSFKSYLFSIALNHIRKYFNKRELGLRYIQHLQANLPYEEPSTKEEDFEYMLQRVNQIIEELPTRKREIFIKSKLEGKSAKAIAAELGISPGTVDNHISEALSIIRSHFDGKSLAILLFIELFYK